MKYLIGALLLTASCSNESKEHSISTVDSVTVVAPQPNQVITDTDNHNVGSQSEVALDSPNGPKILDTLKHH